MSLPKGEDFLNKTARPIGPQNKKAAAVTRDGQSPNLESFFLSGPLHILHKPMTRLLPHLN